MKNVSLVCSQLVQTWEIVSCSGITFCNKTVTAGLRPFQDCFVLLLTFPLVQHLCRCPDDSGREKMILQLVSWVHAHGVFRVCYTYFITVTSEKCACCTNSKYVKYWTGIQKLKKELVFFSLQNHVYFSLMQQNNHLV